ncbi:hypothetical protein SBD_6146 [Streptomyces bottropensis ATCC 25435]|jgi:hypothetical protein|uniref:Uncharacterized protein n=1 Tax=Streptomyces bottropensis ATCC 25435 TaxID=1054862 RepID=M3FJG0_9ACTN|nr:hypothetical protein SBD_6146 [Streptomyces bottropensis ATCC 25435]
MWRDAKSDAKSQFGMAERRVELLAAAGLCRHLPCQGGQFGAP